MMGYDPVMLLGLWSTEVWFGTRGGGFPWPVHWKGWLVTAICLGLVIPLDYIARYQHMPLFDVAAFIAGAFLIAMIRQHSAKTGS